MPEESNLTAPRLMPIRALHLDFVREVLYVGRKVVIDPTITAPDGHFEISRIEYMTDPISYQVFLLNKVTGQEWLWMLVPASLCRVEYVFPK